MSNTDRQGNKGEKQVRKVLASLGAGYKVYNDFIIPAQNGTTTQIDHCVVSKHGIFVIETKSHTGDVIYGNEKAEKWSEYKNGHEQKFYNPLRQNYGHIESLKAVLGLHDDNAFVRIICFSSNPELKVDSREPVVTLENLKREIKLYDDVVLRDEDVERACKILNENIKTDNYSKAEHTENLKANLRSNREKVENGICPKCGAPLEIVNGEYGEYIRCTNFPECRFRQAREKPKAPKPVARPKPTYSYTNSYSSNNSYNNNSNVIDYQQNAFPVLSDSPKYKRRYRKRKKGKILKWILILFVISAIAEGTHQAVPTSTIQKPAKTAKTESGATIASGTVFYHKYGDEPNTLRISVPKGDNYYIELKDNSGLVVLKFFMAGGDTADVKIPVGRYTIDFVKGDRWIDEEQLFGPEGVRVEDVASVFSAWDAKELIAISIK